MRTIGLLALLLLPLRPPAFVQAAGATPQVAPETIKECYSRLLKTTLHLEQGSHAILDKYGSDSKVFLTVRDVDAQLQNAAVNIRFFQALSTLKEQMACDPDRAAVGEALRINGGLAEMSLTGVKIILPSPTDIPAEMPADIAQDIKDAAALVKSCHRMIAEINKKQREEKKGDKK